MRRGVGRRRWGGPPPRALRGGGWGEDERVGEVGEGRRVEEGRGRGVREGKEEERAEREVRGVG
ncbi:MAG: hypothetical protein ACKESB_01590, partial [Candidatus Hodgkinia cicadicola]